MSEEMDPKLEGMLLEGGGIGVLGMQDADGASKLHTFVEGDVMVAFTGELTNLKYLMMKVGMLEHATWTTSTAQLSSPAKIIHRLYAEFGRVRTLGKLRGVFSFVVYDSSIARVFAARDPSGQLQLFQGCLEDKCLFVSNYKPANSTTSNEVPPGHFVAGARRIHEPEQFLPDKVELETMNNKALEAASKALRGLPPVRTREQRVKHFSRHLVEAPSSLTPIATKRAAETPLVDSTASPTDTPTQEMVARRKTKRGTRGGVRRNRKSHTHPSAECKGLDAEAAVFVPAEFPDKDSTSSREVEADVAQAPEKVDVESMPLQRSASVSHMAVDVAAAERTISQLVTKFSNSHLPEMMLSPLGRSSAAKGGLKRVGSCSRLNVPTMLGAEVLGFSGLKTSLRNSMTRVASLSHIPAV